MYTLIKANGQYCIEGGGMCIAEITANTIEAYALIYMLNEHKVSPWHVHDVIEDFGGCYRSKGDASASSFPFAQYHAKIYCKISHSIP